MWLRATSLSWNWREGVIHATFEKECFRQMDDKCKVAATAKSWVCVKLREASPLGKQFVLRVQQFPTWNKGDFSEWIPGGRRPKQKGLWAYLGTFLSRTSNPEFWDSHVLWKHSYPDSWVWCSLLLSPTVLRGLPWSARKAPQRKSIDGLCCPNCLPWDGQIWWLGSQLCQHPCSPAVTDSP